MSFDILLTSLIVVLLPGTGVLYTLAFGLSKGWRASVFAAIGCTLGILPHMGASIAGLAALLHTSALAFQVIKYAGVAYLLYMAWSVLREGGALHIAAHTRPIAPAKIVANGFLVNILNPKLSLFFLAFLPQFVPADAARPTMDMLALAGIFMLMTLVVFVGYGAFAAAARRYVISRPRVMWWLRGSFAAAFGALGIRLALAER